MTIMSIAAIGSKMILLSRVLVVLNIMRYLPSCAYMKKKTLAIQLNGIRFFTYFHPLIFFE